jgi:DNA-binding transcriptional MerR regulator
MKEKRFKSINEVSKLLGLNSHVIRYWDSKFDGLSTRLSPKGQRFFNSANIKKLKNLKLTLYNNGKHNYSLDLAKRIMNKQDSNVQTNNNNKESKKNTSEIYKDSLKNLILIRENLKKLLET